MFAFATSLIAVGIAGPGTVIAESWRLFGPLVFAEIFLLLASRPQLYPGIWELAIIHQAATATCLFSVASDAPEAAAAATLDGGLTVVLVVAYLLARADRNWARFRNRSAATPRVARFDGDPRRRAPLEGNPFVGLPDEREDRSSPGADVERVVTNRSRLRPEYSTYREAVDHVVETWRSDGVLPRSRTHQ